MLSIPRRLIDRLGLTLAGTRQVRTANGARTAGVYGAVRLGVQGRSCVIDVVEVPDDCPVLIGQVPLEILDFVVDLNGQRLIGNPAHGGEQMIELYSFLPESPR
jgi:predicted aspartyl protease